jgi:nucleoside phosphorylase
MVSESIFPYDQREVFPAPLGVWERFFPSWRRRAAWTYSYNSRATTYASRPEFQTMFRAHQAAHQGDNRLPFNVQFGCLLSGSAKIASKAYRNAILRSCLEKAPGLIGGEMESVGLLSLDAAERPRWIVVKGISDFADDRQVADATSNRRLACANAAHFVLGALLRWNP